MMPCVVLPEAVEGVGKVDVESAGDASGDKVTEAVEGVHGMCVYIYVYVKNIV